MPVYALNEDLIFPNPRDANEQGLLGIGGNLSPDRLLLAYELGIFPWYGEDQPILWWSPDPRCLLKTADVKVSKSMRNILNRGTFTVTYDTAFDQVIEACAVVDRKDGGTWLQPEMVAAYQSIFDLGMGHSVEVWQDGALVGGLYGISLGSMFFGESMFSKVSNASKVALIHLCRRLQTLGFEWVDCQVENPHLTSLGAITVSREEFLEHLRQALKDPTIPGPWTAHSAFST